MTNYDDFDDYDERTASKSSKFIRYCKDVLHSGKDKKDYEEYYIFDSCSVSWAGYMDGKVDPNPMCSTCQTQLSFFSKDSIICDACHKNKTKLGEFYFEDGSGSILTYQQAYQQARKRWLELLEELEEI